MSKQLIILQKYPSSHLLAQVHNRNTRKRYEICSNHGWKNQVFWCTKQVQGNVVHLVILCTLRYQVHVFALSCTSSCTKENMLRKDEAIKCFAISSCKSGKVIREKETQALLPMVQYIYIYIYIYIYSIVQLQQSIVIYSYI